MWLQLSRWLSPLIVCGLCVRSGLAWAQSAIKYKHLRYDESSPGIDVDEDALEVLLQFENEDQASFSVLHDVITGASPTGLPATDTTTGASLSAGRGQQFAKFNDERWAYSAGYAPLIGRTTRLDTKLYYSTERDYLSRGATLGAAFDLNEKNTIIAPAVTHFDDRVEPANGKPIRGRRSTHGTLDLSQVLNRWNVLRAGFDYGQETGYLTDPYKQVLVGDTPVDESRPDSRIAQLYSAGLRTQPFDHHAFDVYGVYYSDDWRIRSRALRLKSLNDLGDDWLWELMYRFYYQGPAYFWNDEFGANNTDRHRSSDTRLAHLVSNTYGATLIYKASEAWWIEAALAYYAQNGKRANEATPYSQGDAVVSATIYSLAVQYRYW